MRMTCPSCHAEMSLEALLESESARQAVARLAVISLPFGALVLRYVALFRPAKRRLSIERMVALIEELLPDIERGRIERKGRDWAAPRDTWQAAIDTVLAARDKGTLTPPLTSHGYLYEVILGMADKHEAQLEREREQQARSRPNTAGPQAVATALATRTDAAPAPAPYVGPSKAALRIQAEIAARRKPRDEAGESAQGYAA